MCIQLDRHSASRFNVHFPIAQGSSGHWSVIMLISKDLYNGIYSNKLWSLAAQGIFQLRENQPDGVSREMCEYLKWELNVDEVNTATHRPPPHCPIESQSFAIVWLALSIGTQTSPLPNPSMVYMIPPYNTPSSLYSQSSPALSASPPTPPSIEDLMHRCSLNR